VSDETIGSALVHKRTELGVSKVQAAQIVGMSRTTYSSYERDAQRPSVEVIPALVAFLQVSTESFLKLYGATAVATLRASLEHTPLTSAEFVEGVGVLNLVHHVTSDEFSLEAVGASSVASHISDELDVADVENASDPRETPDVVPSLTPFPPEIRVIPRVRSNEEKLHAKSKKKSGKKKKNKKKG